MKHVFATISTMLQPMGMLADMTLSFCWATHRQQLAMQARTTLAEQGTSSRDDVLIARQRNLVAALIPKIPASKTTIASPVEGRWPYQKFLAAEQEPAVLPDTRQTEAV